MTQITWTKCSERMPPDDVKMVMLRNYKEPKYISKLYAFRLPILKLLREKYEWTPYTPEAWKELNK